MYEYMDNIVLCNGIHLDLRLHLPWTERVDCSLSNSAQTDFNLSGSGADSCVATATGISAQTGGLDRYQASLAAALYSVQWQLFS